MFNAKVDNFAIFGKASAIHQINDAVFEGRSNLILHDLDLDGVTNNFGAVFNGIGSPKIQTNRSIEFQSATTSRGFGVAIHGFTRQQGYYRTQCRQDHQPRGLGESD